MSKGPWSPCKCGGKYRLEDEPRAAVYHTLPMCQRYLNANTTEEIIQYSRENRHTVGIYAPGEKPLS